MHNFNNSVVLVHYFLVTQIKYRVNIQIHYLLQPFDERGSKKTNVLVKKLVILSGVVKRHHMILNYVIYKTLTIAFNSL